jgi:TRAP-type C4-dicarboxylate transport system permease small subunit
VDSFPVTWGLATVASGLALAVSIAMKFRKRQRRLMSWLVAICILIFLFSLVQWVSWYA